MKCVATGVRVCVGSLLALSLLACGGGGGSGSETPPPSGNPPPTGNPPPSSGPTALSVSASRSLAFEDDAPISLTSTPDEGAATTWTVSPPVGKLSATSGATVTYTPPRLNELSADVTVTITAAAAGLQSATVTIPIYRSSFSASAARLDGSATAGHPGALVLTITPVQKPAGTVYAVVNDPKSVLKSPAIIVANPDGTFTANFTVSDELPADTYSATAVVALCGDAACSLPLPGRPLYVPYTVVVAGNTGLTALSPWTGVADWATYQGNIAHTGYVPVTIRPLAIGKRWGWTSPPNNGVPMSVGHLSASAGRVFVNAGNTIQAISEDDATALWNYDVTGISWVLNTGAQDPAVYDGRVYFSGGHQNSTYLFVLDAASGALQYKSLMSSQWEQYLAPVVQGGNVYTEGGSYGGLYGFDDQGFQLFFANAEQTDHWSPAVDQNHVYTYTGASGYAYLRQIDRFTGAVVRSIQDSSFQFGGYRMNGAPVLTAAGGVLAYNNGVSLTSFDVTNGVIGWQQSGNYASNPALANGVVYAVNRSPYRLEAREQATGQVKWSWSPQAPTETNFVGDVMVTQNLVFLSTNSTVYAIDLATHQAVWTYPKPALLALSSSGILYLSTTDPYGQSDGTILAFNTH